MGNLKKHLIEAMDDLLQRNLICHFVLVFGEEMKDLGKIYAIDAYMKTCEIAKMFDIDVWCFMAPMGERAASPIFCVEKKQIILSGLLIGEINEGQSIILIEMVSTMYRTLLQHYAIAVGKNRLH